MLKTVSGFSSLKIASNNLVVGDSFSVVSNGNVGISNTAPTHKLSVNGDVFVNTSVTVGNSSVNATVNSTIFTGTANNSTYFGGYTWAAPALLGGTTANGGSFTYANVSGQVNTATLYATTSANIASVVQANSTGVYVAAGANAISLTNATSNWIYWNSVGTAAPAFTTRSAGTKLILYPAIGASAVDYALGINAGTLWSSIPGNDGGQFFKWYGGTTEVASLSGTGQMQILGTVNAASHSVGTSFVANTTQVTIAGIPVSSNGSTGTGGQVLTSNGATGSPYWSTVGTATQIRQSYTANGSQTVFTVTGGYTTSLLDVYVNGVKLLNGSDVDVTSGSTFTITPAPANTATIEVVGYSNVAVSLVTVNVAAQYAWTNTHSFSNTVTLAAISANGSLGTAAQALFSNGTATYWANVVGGAGYYKGGSVAAGTASNANNIFRINAQTLSFDTTINGDENATCTGPLIVAAGKTLSVAAGGRIAIV